MKRSSKLIAYRRTAPFRGGARGTGRDPARGAPGRRRERAALAALGLSGRQAEILGLVAGGRTNADIVAILCISPRTVQKHLEHVYDRLGVRSRAAAAAAAVSAIGYAPC